MSDGQGHFSISYFRCGDCGNSILTEKKACPRCGSFALERKESQGKGKVIDSAIIYFPPKSYEAMAPYTSVLVNMGEGFKIIGIMEGEVKDLPRDTPLIAVRADERAGGVIFKKAANA